MPFHNVSTFADVRLRALGMVGLYRQHIVEARSVDAFNHAALSRTHRDTAARGVCSGSAAFASAGKHRVYGCRMETTRKRSFYLDQPSEHQSLRSRAAPLCFDLRNYGNCSVSSTRAIRCNEVVGVRETAFRRSPAGAANAVGTALSLQHIECNHNTG